MQVHDVMRMLKKLIAASGSQKNWAEANGISAAYVSDVLKRRADPGPLLLKVLGLERVVSYRKVNGK